VPLRRVALISLLALLFLAWGTRLISGVGILESGPQTELAPETAFGSLIYVDQLNALHDGFLIWEFKDLSCTGYFRILKMPLSGETEELSQILRLPGEDVTYWYNDTIYDQAARTTWLVRYAMEEIRSILQIKNRTLRSDFYLKIFHPAACEVPSAPEWTKLAAAIHQ
jgi:hypothetical protein